MFPGPLFDKIFNLLVKFWCSRPDFEHWYELRLEYHNWVLIIGWIETNVSIKIQGSDDFCGIVCRFMKLRLDRVLSESYEAESLEEALASNPTDIKFEKPEKWVAPYPKYEYGWWETFLPHGSKEEAKV